MKRPFLVRSLSQIVRLSLAGLLVSMLTAYDVHATVDRAYWHTDFQNGNSVLKELDITPVTPSKEKESNFYTPANIRKMSRR